MDIYREILLDHYHAPRNYGSLPAEQAQATAANVSCGDTITMSVVLDDHQKIAAVGFTGVGCAITMASASLLTEHIKGKSVTEVYALKIDDVCSLLGTTLTPSRVKCAMLPLEVLHKAIAESLSMHRSEETQDKHRQKK